MDKVDHRNYSTRNLRIILRVQQSYKDDFIQEPGRIRVAVHRSGRASVPHRSRETQNAEFQNTLTQPLNTSGKAA